MLVAGLIHFSLEVHGIVVGKLLLCGKVRVLTVMAHWAEVVVRGLRQIVMELASDVHGKSDTVSRVVKLVEFVIIVSLRLG